MSLLFLFLDGIGLGADDPEINPFAQAEMPALKGLLNGQKLVKNTAPLNNQRATLLSLDACLGVDGMPQSATGQAVLLTGKNLPAEIGYHYGPKPNLEVARVVENGNLFSIIKKSNRSAALLNAYPPRYFEGIKSGKRIYSSIPLAVTSAGFELKTLPDLLAGQALAADFTAQGWREHLGVMEVPVYSPQEAGKKLAALAQEQDFCLFEYWLSDYVGHGQEMEEACNLLATIDGVLEGLIDAWDHHNDLIVLTSDHGNLEDLSTRRHTMNPVPALLIGSFEARQRFSADLKDISGIAPAILQFLDISNDSLPLSTLS